MRIRSLESRDDLKNLVKPLIRKATKLVLKNRYGTDYSHTQLQSHFGGQPYFEKGEAWPKAKNGNNLVFVCQIFNENDPAFPENVKLIQFYYDFDDLTPWHSEDDGWLVKVYETLNKENMEFVKKPDEFIHKYWNKPETVEPWNWVNYCEVEFKPMLSLPNEPEEAGKEIDRIFDKSNIDYQDIAKELVGDEDFCSKVGGYPQWIQFGIEKKKDFEFLFQIDSEDDAGLMWSDCGMLYFFYNSKTKQVIFEKECY